MSRVQVPATVFSSTEYQQKLVESYYQGFLRHRCPGPRRIRRLPGVLPARPVVKRTQASALLQILGLPLQMLSGGMRPHVKGSRLATNVAIIQWGDNGVAHVVQQKCGSSSPR
jgi:hypothetical protein